MPGKRWNSLKAPGTYEKLKKHGFAKGNAARLSNWMAKMGYKVKSSVRSRFKRQ